MKKVLCFVLSIVILVFSSVTFGAFASEESLFDMPLDYEIEIASENYEYDEGFHFFAEKDGIYSISRKTASGQVNINDTSKEPDTTDYRTADNTTIYYFNMKKGEELIIHFTCKPNSSCVIVRRTVDLITDGTEIDFNGEYDKSFVLPSSSYYGNYKFCSNIPKDENGTPILNARYRIFEFTPIDGVEDYLRRKDIKINTAFAPSSITNTSDYYVFNIYSYKSNLTTADVKTANSKVKFIKLDNFNTDAVKFNLVENPENLYENSNCFTETDEDGNSYKKYYYSHKNYLKSITVDFYDDIKTEVMADADAYDEKEPYSRYTGLYPEYTDTQKTTHWKVGTNYFKVNFSDFNRMEIPVVLKSADELERLEIYTEKNIDYYANTLFKRKYVFTPSKTDTYTLSIIVDNSNSSIINDITAIIDGKPYTAKNSYPTTNNCQEYLLKDINLKGGISYPIEFHFDYHGDNNGQIKLSIKKLVNISSIKANLKSNSPKLVEGFEKINNRYSYDISDYVDNIDVTFEDGKVCNFKYDNAKQTFLSTADKKYSSHNVYFSDNQTTNIWYAGTNYAYIAIEDTSADVPIEMVDKNDLDNFEVEKEHSATFNSNGKYKAYYKFEPETSGFYAFSNSTLTHNNNCSISISTNLAGYYDNVDENAPVRLMGGMTYVVILSAKHNDSCSNTDFSNLSVKIKLSKVNANSLGDLTTNEENTINNFDSNGEFCVIYSFKPSETANYDFNISTKTHNNNCKIITDCKVYLRGKEVTNSFYSENNTYNVVVFGYHDSSVCDNKRYYNISVSITPTKHIVVTKPTATTATTTTTSTSTKPVITTTTTTGSVTTKNPTNTTPTSTTTKPVSVTTIKPSIKPTESHSTQLIITQPITKITLPNATKIKRLIKGKKLIKVTWKKINGIKGYQIQVATDKKFKKNIKTVTIKKAKSTKSKIKKLKAKKKYFVRICTYKVINGRTIYSKWSPVKTIKTK